MPDRFLTDTVAGEDPTGDEIQQIVEAEHGRGAQGISRTWQASDSSRVVLTSTSSGVKISRDNGTTAPQQVIVDGTAAGGGLTGTYPNPGLSPSVIVAGTPAGGHLSGTYPNPSVSQSILDLVCPPGTIIAYGGSGVPTGWLSCDGAIVAIATYPRLASVLGTTYGGNGTTTFGVPDLRGRFPLGASAPHGLGQTGGQETVAGPPHTHPQTHLHDMQGHLHGFDHNHSLNAHIHDMNGHGHATNLDHDHLVLTATAAASGSTPNGRFTAGGANALPDNHTHTVSVDLPGLGSTPVRSATPVDPASGSALPNTGVANPTTTPNLSAVWTGGPQAAGGAPIPNTGTDSTAGAASFPGSIATMPPYLAIQYRIRTGN